MSQQGAGGVSQPVSTPADSPFATPPVPPDLPKPFDASAGDNPTGAIHTGLAMANANLDSRATGAGDVYPTGTPTPGPAAGPVGQDQTGDGTLPQGVSLGSSDLARRAAQLYKTFPDLQNQPQLVAQLVQLPVTDDSLVGSVGRTQAGASAQALYATLNGLTDAKARAQVWKKLSQPVQQSLVSMGMTPPQAPGGHGGSWLDVFKSLALHNPVTALPDIGIQLAQGHFQGAVEAGVGDTLGTLGTALAATGRAVGTDIIKPAANAVGVGGAYQAVGSKFSTLFGAPSHIYRFLSYDPRTGGSHPITGTAQAPVVNPGAPDSPGFSWHWVSKAWEATGRGKPFYSDAALTQLNKALPNDLELQQLAESVSRQGGDLTAGLTQYLGKAPTDPAKASAYKAKAAQLLARAAPDGVTLTPQFASAVQGLTYGGVSWGRDGARIAGLKEGTPAYKDVSGGLDGVYQWYLNPLVVAGKARSVVEGARAMADPADVMAELKRLQLSDNEAASLQTSLGRSTDLSFWPKLATAKLPESYNVGDGSMLQRLVRPADSLGRIRMLAALAGHANDGNVAGWAAAFPHSVDMVHNFLEWAHGPEGPISRALAAGDTPSPFNVNDALGFMRSKAAAFMHAQGAGDTYLHDSDLQLPRLTKLGLARAQAKLAVTPAARIADTSIPPDWLNQGDLHRQGSVFSGIANQVHQLFRPANTARVVHLTGLDSLSSYERFLSQFRLPDWTRASLLHAWSTTPQMAVRRQIMRDTLAGGLKKTALGQTDGGNMIIDRMVQNLDQSYDPTGLSRDVTASGAKAALEPDSGLAESMYAPGLRDIAQAARHVAGVSVVNGGLLNGALETFIHRYWAPMALFRAGFIPRVISEEWLTALMRLRPSQVMSAYMGEFLPAAQDRFASWDTFRGQAEPDFSRVLAGHAFGLGPAAKIAFARTGNWALKGLASRIDPTVLAAGTAVRSARTKVQLARHAWDDLVDAVGDRAEAAHIVGVQNLDSYILRSDGGLRMPGDGEDGKTLKDVVKEKRDVLRQAFEAISDDPIVRRAWGKAVFATGGSYRASTSIGDELNQLYEAIVPVEQLKIGRVRKLFHNVRSDADADPAFRQAAADYYGEKSRSATYRQGMAAIQGWLPQEGEQLKLQSLLPADERGGDISTTVQTLRERFASLPEAARDAVRDYLTALGTGDKDGLHYTGKVLREMQTSEGLTDAQRSMVAGMLGDPEYWRRVAEPRFDPIEGRDEELPHGAHPGAPDPLTLSHILADPSAEQFVGRDRAVELAAKRMYDHLTGPGYPAEDLMAADHIVNGAAGPLAERVAPGYRRIYFIDPGVHARGDTNGLVAAIDDVRLHQRAGQTDTEMPTLGLHTFATDDPARAEAMAEQYAQPLRYVDLPEEVAAAQKIGDAHGAHDSSPWKKWAGHRAAETDALADHLERAGANLSERTYWVDRAQAERASSLDGQVTRLADGTLAPGVSLSTAIRNHAHTMAEDLVDAFAPRGQILQPLVQDALRYEGKRTFTVQHLAGIPDNLLPEVVQAAQHITLDSKSLWDRTVRFGFDRVLGPSIDSMVRSPLFILNYARGMRAARILEPHLVDTDLRRLATSAIAGTGHDLRSAREALRQKAEHDDAVAQGRHMGPEEVDTRFPRLEAAKAIIANAEAKRAALPRRYQPPERPWYFHGSPDTTGGIQPVPWVGSQLENLYGPGFYTTDSHQVAQEYAGLRDYDGARLQAPPEAGIHQASWGLTRDPKFVDLDAPAERPIKDAALTVLAGNPDSVAHWGVNTDLMPSMDDWPAAIRSAQTNGEVFEYLRDALSLGSYTNGEEGALAAWKQMHTILGNQGYDGLAHVGGGRVVPGDTRRHNVRIYFDTQPLTVSTKEADAYERALHGWSDMEDHVDDQMRQAAVVRAINDTVPYINNHNARSNFTELARNVAPFLWAQESFYKRWWRASSYNPAQVAKLELGLHGLASMGVIHKDSNGHSVITIPGSAQLSQALTSVGVPYQVAQAVPFTMEVKNMTPGFNRPAAPAWGPLVSVPVGFTGLGSPSESALMQAVDGTGTQPGWVGLLGEVVPSGTVRNVFHALVRSADPQAYGSAQMQALQLLAAGGHIPGESATPTEITTYNQRLSAWTRNIMLLRAALGFFTPATPTLDFGDMTSHGVPVARLDGDLRDMIAMFGVTEGMQRFAAMHPDANPYTIFRGTSAGLETPPATAEALSTIQSHQGFFDAHPVAGAYFLPAGGSNDLYSRAAMAAETAAGMRRVKGWDQITTEMATQAASTYYYAAHDEYLKEFAQAAGNTTAQANITKNWSAFSKSVLAENPLFAQQLNSSTGTATRAAVLADVRAALGDGDAPAGDQTDHLRLMVGVYDSWNAARVTWTGNRTARATQARTDIDRQFAQWGSAYVAANPDMAGFWSRIVAPEITSADKSVGQDVEGAQLDAASA